jgi:hypothetical protein
LSIDCDRFWETTQADACESRAPNCPGDHAVVFNGFQTHISGQFNGDRWSQVLFVHASWGKASKEAASELRKLGLPCPTENYNGYNVAPPAAVDPVSIPEKAGSSDDPVIEDEVVEEVPAGWISILRGSAEEARTMDRLLTHLSKNPHCEVCAKANVQRTSKRKKRAVAIGPDAIVFRIQDFFGAQVTADHLIKNDDGEEDDGIPVDTVAVVLLDRGKGWIALYPKASKSTEHNVDAFQHIAGAKENIASFYCDNAPELKAAALQCA